MKWDSYQWISDLMANGVAPPVYQERYQYQYQDEECNEDYYSDRSEDRGHPHITKGAGPKSCPLSNAQTTLALMRATITKPVQLPPHQRSIHTAQNPCKKKSCVFSSQLMHNSQV